MFCWFDLPLIPIRKFCRLIFQSNCSIWNEFGCMVSASSQRCCSTSCHKISGNVWMSQTKQLATNNELFASSFSWKYHGCILWFLRKRKFLVLNEIRKFRISFYVVLVPFVYLEMGHRSNDSIPSSGRTRHSWRIHHKTSTRRTWRKFTRNSIFDGFNIRWRCHEISSYVSTRNFIVLPNI